MDRVWRPFGPAMMRARDQAQCAQSATAEERAYLGPRLCARVQQPRGGEGANEEEDGGAYHQGPSYGQRGAEGHARAPGAVSVAMRACGNGLHAGCAGATTVTGPEFFRDWTTGRPATARPRGRFAPGPGPPRPFWRPWATSPSASTTRWRAGGRQPQRGSARAGGCALHGQRSIASAFGPTPSTRAPGDWTARACCTYRW